jgi:hypothetical protein
MIDDVSRRHYPVGYCRPPQHAQFRKGQSGNPSGRRRGTSNLATTVNETLFETVTVIERGRRKKMTKMEVAIMKLTNKAAAGDGHALRTLAKLRRATPNRNSKQQLEIIVSDKKYQK